MDILSHPGSDPAELQEVEQGTRAFAVTSADKAREAFQTVMERVVLEDKRVELQLSRRRLSLLILEREPTAESGNDRDD